MTYKDIINYELAQGIAENKLLEVAQQVYDGWMKHQPGFLKWEIHKLNDTKFVDIVYWKDKKSAKLAETKMGEVPNGQDWFSCYKEGTIVSQNVELVKEFEE